MAICSVPTCVMFLMTVLVVSGQYYPAYTSSYYRSPYASRYSGGGLFGGLGYPYTQNYYNGYNNIPGRYNYNNFNGWNPSLAYQGGGYSGFGGGYNGYQQSYPLYSYNGFGNYKK